MQISIDKNLCVGCGMCEQKCDKIFKTGEDGKPEVSESDCGCGDNCGCGASCDCDVNEIVKECPAGAIHINL